MPIAASRIPSVAEQSSIFVAPAPSIIAESFIDAFPSPFAVIESSIDFSPVLFGAHLSSIVIRQRSWLVAFGLPVAFEAPEVWPALAVSESVATVGVASPWQVAFAWRPPAPFDGQLRQLFIFPSPSDGLPRQPSVSPSPFDVRLRRTSVFPSLFDGQPR